MVQFCDEWYLYIILSFYLLGSLATEQDLVILAFKLYGIENTVIAISVGVSFTIVYMVAMVPCPQNSTSHSEE